MAAYGDGRYGLSIQAHRRYLDAYRGAASIDFALSKTVSLAGLPPVWLTVAELDILREQSHALAARLRAAQVAVQVDEVPGVIHGFLAYGLMLDAAGAALARAAAWARAVRAEPACPP
jgi:acetyl esterase